MSYEDKVARILDEACYRYGNDLGAIADYLRKQGEKSLRVAQSQYDERVFQVYQNLGYKLLEASSNLY